MQTAVILRFVRKEIESEFVMQTESEGIEKYESLTILYFLDISNSYQFLKFVKGAKYTFVYIMRNLGVAKIFLQ